MCLHRCSPRTRSALAAQPHRGADDCAAGTRSCGPEDTGEQIRRETRPEFPMPPRDSDAAVPTPASNSKRMSAVSRRRAPPECFQARCRSQTRPARPKLGRGNPAAAGRREVDFAQHVDAALENERLPRGIGILDIGALASSTAKTLAIVMPSCSDWSHGQAVGLHDFRLFGGAAACRNDRAGMAHARPFGAVRSAT